MTIDLRRTVLGFREISLSTGTGTEKASIRGGFNDDFRGKFRGAIGGESSMLGSLLIPFS